MAVDLVSSDEQEKTHAFLDGLPGDPGGSGGLANEVPEEVVPRLVDAGGVGFPGSLQLLEVDAAGSV